MYGMTDSYMCDITHSFVWHNSFRCVTWARYMYFKPWLIHTCEMTHSCVWHGHVRCISNRESFIYVTWLIHMCDMTHSNEWHDSFICVTCLIHMCDMTHSYVWHDVTWLIHVCDMGTLDVFRTMTHSYVWNDLFVCVTRHGHVTNVPISHIHLCTYIYTEIGYISNQSSKPCEVARYPQQKCDTTHSYMWHDSLNRDWMSHDSHLNESWVMPHIWMSHVTHMNESCHIYEWVMSHIWMIHEWVVESLLHPQLNCGSCGYCATSLIYKSAKSLTKSLYCNHKQHKSKSKSK